MNWENYLNILINYFSISFPDWQIIFKSNVEDKVLPTTKKIFINKTSSTRRKLYLLLHEIGHVLLLTNENYSEKYKKILEQKSYSQLTYRTGIVEEEIDAWNEGELLAKKLSIPLDKHFNVVRSNKLATYMKWAVKRKK